MFPFSEGSLVRHVREEKHRCPLPSYAYVLQVYNTLTRHTACARGRTSPLARNEKLKNRTREARGAFSHSRANSASSAEQNRRGGWAGLQLFHPPPVHQHQHQHQHTNALAHLTEQRGGGRSRGAGWPPHPLPTYRHKCTTTNQPGWLCRALALKYIHTHLYRGRPPTGWGAPAWQAGGFYVHTYLCPRQTRASVQRPTLLPLKKKNTPKNSYGRLGYLLLLPNKNSGLTATPHPHTR